MLANNQPIRLITQHLDPLALTNSLVRLEDKISSQTYEIAFLQQLTQDKSLLLAHAHSKATEFEVKLSESALQIDLLNHQLREAAIRDERSRKEAETWRARLDKSNQDRLKVIKEKEELVN
jgi:chromosome segregation ATPase